jgi:hypothetical protein
LMGFTVHGTSRSIQSFLRTKRPTVTSTIGLGGTMSLVFGKGVLKGSKRATPIHWFDIASEAQHSRNDGLGNI